MLNPKANTVAIPAPGDLVIEAYWDDSLDVDVDLWVQAPRDSTAVGYSSRANSQTNYLRDDVGIHRDPSGRNYEFAFCRGRDSGRYVINVHLYNPRKAILPIKVRVSASLMKNAYMEKEVATVTVVLKQSGDEQTAFSFELDEKGKLVPRSVSKEYIPLRDADHNSNWEYD